MWRWASRPVRRSAGTTTTDLSDHLPDHERTDDGAIEAKNPCTTTNAATVALEPLCRRESLPRRLPWAHRLTYGRVRRHR